MLSQYRKATYVSHPLALVLFSPEAILLIETVLTPKLKAVTVVHLNTAVCDMWVYEPSMSIEASVPLSAR